jgi:hypothetical protein
MSSTPISSPQKRFYYRNREAEIARSAKWQQANRPRAAANARKRRAQVDVQARHAAARRRRKYGLSPEEFDRLHAAQNGCCAICCNPMTTSGASKCCVDHDHETELVRGLLCARCNLLLGKALDNPLILQAALYYLQGRS